MNNPRTSGLACAMAIMLAVVPAFAQTSTKTQISGLVTDTQGGVLPGATVALREQDTNQERSTTTNADGRYVLSNLDPGTYELTVTMDQFKTSVIRDIRAGVATSVTQDLRLELGGMNEMVTVSATAETVLQREDAAVGANFDNRRVTLLPNARRDAGQLLTLQPVATPLGEIAGARRDQSTFMVDGVDVSEKAFGVPFQTVIPMPVDAVEEFRAAVSNANASFGRSAGGQYTFVTKRGTNVVHGSLYEYHQNDSLNASSWRSNRLGLPKPQLSDNRYGGSIGGPLARDRTFFFTLYEGRRLDTAASVTRIVPTDSLKQGILRFRDAAGVVHSINPAALDPRGLGANSAMLDVLRLYPAPNDSTSGDGLNTSGFTFNYPLETRDNLGIFRVDHVLGGGWQLDGSFKVFNSDNTTTEQIDVVQRRAVATAPSNPRSVSAGLTGLIGSNATNELRFGWVRDDTARNRVLPTAPVPALNVAVDLAGALLAEPVDVGRAASPQSQGIDVFQIIDNVTWAKGDHTIQAGVNLRLIRADQQRTNKVIGTITTPIAELTSATFNPVPASQRPAFIVPADVARYNALYAALLGQVETVGYLSTRNRDLVANPAGTPMTIDSDWSAYEGYVSDSWRMRPSLTLNYGVRYQFQTPPTDPNGLGSVMIYRDTGEQVSVGDYLSQKEQAADRGAVFNPDLAWLPIGNDPLHQSDRNNFSPRVGMAWSPSFRNGFLGSLLGEEQTVIRGGYALVYDRVNIPTFNTIPALAPTFTQLLSFNGLQNAAGQPFRAGVDGAVPLPGAPAVTSPVVPDKPFGDIIASGIDPFVRTPYNHTVDATFQRTLPGNMTIETGYIGRFARNLLQGVALNQVPYNFRDNASGQTFAQAFDALAAQLRAGVAPAAVTAQPWFENLLPNLAPAGTRTVAVAQRQTANIITGNLAALFLGFLDAQAAQPFNNRQVQSIRMLSSAGLSNYHAGFVSLRKRFSGGFTFDVNYTLSESLDQVGFDQTAASAVPNSFDLDAEYGPSVFDLTHVLNSNWVFELPFGDGRRFGSDTGGLLGRLISGWYTAGILSATSGSPLTIIQSTQVWGGDIQFGFNSGAIPTESIATGVYEGVTGSGGVGTGGNPASGGTGLNLFSDPQAVLRSVRPVQVSQDARSGRGVLRGLPFWQLDLTFGKSTRLSDRLNLRVGIDLINAFNTVILANPTLDLRSPATFGVITGERSIPRQIQLSGRLEF